MITFNPNEEPLAVSFGEQVIIYDIKSQEVLIKLDAIHDTAIETSAILTPLLGKNFTPRQFSQSGRFVDHSNMGRLNRLSQIKLIKPLLFPILGVVRSSPP